MVEESSIWPRGPGEDGTGHSSSMTLPRSADVMGAKEQQKYPAVAVQTERESESVEPSPETLMARIALNMR